MPRPNLAPVHGLDGDAQLQAARRDFEGDGVDGDVVQERQPGLGVILVVVVERRL